MKLNISEEEYLAKKEEPVKFSLNKIASKPCVGLWWFVNNKVYSVMDIPENCPEGRFVTVDKEHSRIFYILQEEIKEETPEILQARFNEVERGRVWFVPKTNSYLITCSTEIADNKEVIDRIKYEFGLSGKFVEFRAEVQYDVFEIKVK